MFETQHRMCCAIAVVVLMQLFGCAAKVRVEDVPVLVLLEGGCPTKVTEVVESCDPKKLEGKVALGPDLVCREKREHVTWVAVTPATTPGSLKLTDDEFTVKFTNGPVKPSCDKTRKGVLKCTVSGSAHGVYKYTVSGAACELDPRFYVP